MEPPSLLQCLLFQLLVVPRHLPRSAQVKTAENFDRSQSEATFCWYVQWILAYSNLKYPAARIIQFRSLHILFNAHAVHRAK